MKGRPGYYIGWITNGLVIITFIQKMIFGCWAKRATKEVNAQIAAGLTLEDVVPEARVIRHGSTKISPEDETEIDLDNSDDEEEEDTSTCRQQ